MMPEKLFAIRFSCFWGKWGRNLTEKSYIVIRSTGSENSIIRASSANTNFYHGKTFGTSTFIGVTSFIDINTAIDVATFKHNAQKFFILFHLDRMFLKLFFVKSFSRSHLSLNKGFMRNSHGFSNPPNFF